MPAVPYYTYTPPEANVGCTADAKVVAYKKAPFANADLTLQKPPRRARVMTNDIEKGRKEGAFALSQYHPPSLGFTNGKDLSILGVYRRARRHL